MEKKLPLIVIVSLSALLVFKDVYGKDSKLNSPEELIQSIYANHSESKPLDLCNSKSITPYFSKKILQLLEKDCKCKESSGEVCKLTYDPFIGGQDFLEPNLKPKIKKKTRTNYEVKIYNSNPMTLIYVLDTGKEGIQISDIKSGGVSLLKTLNTP